MLSENQNDVLKIIYKGLKYLDLNWMLIGSVNHVIQGMRKTPHDIDLIVETKQELLKIEEQFKCHSIKPTQYKDYGEYSSYELNLNINSIPIQIMGEYRRIDGQNVWGELNRFKEKKHVMYEGMKLPILSLRQEYNAYVITGRNKKALKIKEQIERNED